MNNLENLRNELKEIRDILARLDKEIHNNILGLSRRIFESQTSMTRNVQEVLNLCLKLDNWEMDSQNISRELLRRHITGMNLNQSLWTKTLVGLSLLIFATLVICLYIVINDPQLSELIVQKIQIMKGESPMIVETPVPSPDPKPPGWYNNKWFLLGMGCVCIFTIYGLSKFSTYGLWDSILPASRKQFDKDSLDLNNKLKEVNYDILRAREGAQRRIDNMSNLGDLNRENLRDIHEGLGDTRNKNLSEALELLKDQIDTYSSKVDGLQEGALAQSEMISRMTQELVPRIKGKEIISESTPGGDESSTGLIKGTSLFRHQIKRNPGKYLGSKGKDLDSHEGTSGKSVDDIPEGSSSGS